MPHSSEIEVSIHIGLHKTGSTTLQSFLSTNRAVFREAGFLYPVSGRGNPGSGQLMTGHHNLAWQLRSEVDYFSPESGTWDDLVEEIESGDAGSIILSSEDFDTITGSAIAEIGRHLSGYRVKVIIYLRRQDLAIQSDYAGRIKRGIVSKDFQTYIERAISVEQRLRYAPLLAPWKEQFGSENIRVRPFESGQLKGGLCRDFLRCVEFPEKLEHSLTFVTDRNIAPSLKTLEAAKIARRLMLMLGADPENLEPCMKALLKCAERNEWNTEKLRLVTRQDYTRILSAYAESNAAVAREFLARESGDLFHEDYDDSPVSNFDPSRFSDAEFLDIVSIVLKHR